jgi:hypothetical protein
VNIDAHIALHIALHIAGNIAARSAGPRASVDIAAGRGRGAFIQIHSTGAVRACPARGVSPLSRQGANR